MDRKCSFSFASTVASRNHPRHSPCQCSATAILFRWRPHRWNETIAMDLHTHDRSRAFLWPIDNGDDRGIKVADVFGHLHLDKPSAAFRLAVNGFYQPLHHPWEESRPTRDGLAVEPRKSILNWLDWERGRIWNM